MVGGEFVAETKDAMRAWFGGVEVVFRAFEGGKFFSGEVFWKAFDRETGKIVGHSIESLKGVLRVFIRGRGDAD